MQTKLTLRLEEKIIKKAKAWGKCGGSPCPRLFRSFSPNCPRSPSSRPESMDARAGGRCPGAEGSLRRTRRYVRSTSAISKQNTGEAGPLRHERDPRRSAGASTPLCGLGRGARCRRPRKGRGIRLGARRHHNCLPIGAASGFSEKPKSPLRSPLEDARSTRDRRCRPPGTDQPDQRLQGRGLSRGGPGVRRLHDRDPQHCGLLKGKVPAVLPEVFRA